MPGYHVLYDVGFQGIADAKLVLDIMKKAILVPCMKVGLWIYVAYTVWI